MRALFTAVCLSVIFAGCSRVEPVRAPVAAEDPPAFAAWQRKVAGGFPAELQQEFAGAIQEIRFDVVAKNEATGHDAIEAALCKRINARTVSEVVLSGHELKLHRLETERDDLQRAMNTNAHLITKPGDEGAARQLEQIRAQQQQRLDAANTAIQAVERSIQAHGGVVGPKRMEGAAAVPLERISRGEAMQQIAEMMQERRNPAVLKYGGWPVKIDREGLQLDEAMRRDFLVRKAVAEKTGQIVIPIRIKEHWLLFEGPNEAPQLPKFVQASVTDADRRKFEQDWVNLAAEAWARETAASFEIPPPTLKPPPSLGTQAPGLGIDVQRDAPPDPPREIKLSPPAP